MFEWGQDPLATWLCLNVDKVEKLGLDRDDLDNLAWQACPRHIPAPR